MLISKLTILQSKLTILGGKLNMLKGKLTILNGMLTILTGKLTILQASSQYFRQAVSSRGKLTALRAKISVYLSVGMLMIPSGKIII